MDINRRNKEGVSAFMLAYLPVPQAEQWQIDEGVVDLDAHAAKKKGRCDLQKWILTVPGVDVSAKLLDTGRSVFHGACQRGQMEAVESLLVLIADVNEPDTHGKTGLRLAASHGHTAVVAMLLSAGADPNIADATGRTCLMEACMNGKPGVVSFCLWQPTVDANATDEDGNTAFIHMCIAGDYDVLEIMGSKPKIDINLRNKVPIVPTIIDVTVVSKAGATGFTVACLANNSMFAAQLMLLPAMDLTTVDASVNFLDFLSSLSRA
ncbi:hypothetical protein ACHHYP_09374 [Achlya hypogyna]|uniref:Uncharacterized protein n=1 Tax=Achlya hypogyna TaxID=1202772 RepID=A0A1V9ZJ18_ACHHY|nr:hypothetical protein ACHHYP_09374 [Achlya hypogyna]